jgi:hypothetical protein
MEKICAGIRPNEIWNMKKYALEFAQMKFGIWKKYALEFAQMKFGMWKKYALEFSEMNHHFIR